MENQDKKIAAKIYLEYNQETETNSIDVEGNGADLMALIIYTMTKDPKINRLFKEAVRASDLYAIQQQDEETDE